MLRKKVIKMGFYRTEEEFRRAVMNLFEHISDYKERLESILTLNFDWLIPKPFRCDYNIVIAFKGEEKGGTETERRDK